MSVDDRTEPQVGVYYQDQCSPTGPYDVQMILQTGIIAANQCWNKNPKLKELHASPGEIILFRDRMSFWERLRHMP